MTVSISSVSSVWKRRCSSTAALLTTISTVPSSAAAAAATRSARASGVSSTLVESGPLTQIELATATATDRTAMVYLLDELEQQGLVERMPNPDDRRSYLIHLTPQGTQTQRKAAAELATQADTLLKPLAAAERRQLVDLLTRIADHWDELNPGGAKKGMRPAQALQALQNL